MKRCIHAVLAVLVLFPLHLFALADDDRRTMPDTAAEIQPVQQTIPYKAPSEVKASFVKVLVVFVLMIALAYAGIRSLKFLQSDAFIGRGKPPLVKVLESRKLDTRTSVHVIAVEAERFMVTQNGHGLLVTRLNPNVNVEEKVTQDV